MAEKFRSYRGTGDSYKAAQKYKATKEELEALAASRRPKQTSWEDKRKEKKTGLAGILEELEGVVKGAGTFAGGMADEFTRAYRQTGEGVGNVVGEFTGENEKIRSNQKKAQEDQLAIIKTAQKKLKDPNLSPEEKVRWSKLAKATATQSEQSFKEADAYNTELQEENDPIQGAANVGRIGVDVISGGSLTALKIADKANKTSKGFRIAKGGARTGRLSRSADDIVMGTKQRIARQGAAGAALEGAYSPIAQYAEDREINLGDTLRDTGMGAAFGSVAGAADGLLTRGARKKLNAKEEARLKEEMEFDESTGNLIDEMDARDAILEQQRNAPKQLGSGEDTARTRLQEIKDLKRAQNEGTADATTFEDRLPGMDELGRPATRTQTPELTQRATQLEDEVTAVDEEIANIARQKDEVVLDDIKFNTARKDLELAHDKALEEISKMPGPSRPGALDSRAIMATNLEKKFEADMTELVNRYESRDELAKTFDDALEEASTRRFEIEAQGTRELEEISAREAQVQMERQEAVRNMSADDWRKLNQEEEELTKQVTELERIKTLSASDVTGPDTEDLLDPQKSPENFNEDGTLNTEKVKTEFKERQRVTAEVNREKAFKETATAEPDTPVTATDRQAVLEEAAADIEANQGTLGSKTLAAWAPFELPSIVIRKMGLEKTAERLDKQILHFKRANHDDIKIIDSVKKDVKDKDSDLFDAVTDPDKYNALSVKGKQAVNAWKEFAKKSADELGIPPEARIQDYIHHAFLKGGRDSVAKLTSINKTIADLEDLVENGGRTGRSLGATKAALTKARNARDELLTVNSSEISRMMKDTGKINPNFLKKRQGAEGYDKNFWSMWEMYSQQKNRKVHIEPISMELADIANTGISGTNHMKGWLEGYSQQLRGIVSETDKTFNRFTLGKGVGALKAGRTSMSLAKLGFSANSVVNSTSQVINMAPVLGAVPAARGSAEALALIGRLSKNTAFREENELFEKMARDGLFEGSAQLIPEETFKKYGHNVKKAAFSGIMGADRYMRMTAYLGAKHTKKGQELSKKAEEFAKANPKGTPNPHQDALDAYSIMMSNKVNQNFDQVVSPTFFRSQVARSLGSMVTFMPGQIVRGVDVAGGGAKGVYRTLSGKSISEKTMKEDAEKIAKVLYLAGGTWLANQAIGRVTGQEDAMPNIFNQDTWSTPSLQLLVGSDNQEGILGLLAKDDDVEGDQAERAMSFFTETLPSYTVPGWSQGKRTMEGRDVNELGYSERADGGAAFFREDNDPISDLQRLVFGKYSTPNGREYVKSGFNNFSKDETSDIMSAASPAEKEMYTSFYKADNDFTETVRKDFKIKGGKDGLSKEITKLINDGNENKARRYAEEWNAIVDLAYEEPLSQYQGMIPEDLLKEVEKMKIPSDEAAFQRRYKQK